MNIPIRIITATRKTIGEYKNSKEYRALAKFNKNTPIQLRLYDQNNTGLSELYNKAIEEVINIPCIMVFMHDDILITDYYWGERIFDGLKKFDICGVVGNKRRLHNQASWIIINEARELDDFNNLSGAIGQGSKFPPEKIDTFGPVGLECKQMDGCFLSVSSETLRKTGLRFDPNFKFHFYDVDFCRSAEQLKLRMGTIPLSLIHESYGKLDKEWKKSYEQYLQKWKT